MSNFQFRNLTQETADEWFRAKGFVKQPDGSWKKPKRVVPHLRATPSAKSEPADLRQRDDSVPRKAIYPGRVRISLTSYVCGQLRDEDNICPKFFTDMLRHVGLIRDDSPECVEFEKTKEVRVSTKKEEGCEIVITPL